MMIRRVMFLSMLCAACGGDDGGGGVSVSGNAFLFNGGPGAEGRLANATITLVEDPTRTTTTAADGGFSFDGFAEGDKVTFALAMPDYHAIQTGTITVGTEPIERVTFQVVHDAIYQQLGTMLAVTPDPARCQVVTTVTRVGKSLYDEGAHGEAGALVTLAPSSAEEGPIYFNASVFPDRSETMTTEDGGVLFFNVPPGNYWLNATKAGATFRAVEIECRAGFLVNASPPWGLQAL